MAVKPAARALLTWYRKNRRTLPWRPGRDPYRVWVAEIMLQQTRAETVAPYYLRWIERFPTLASLAGASDSQVLRSWEGLGYYRRALALRDGARRVVADHGGALPREPSALLRLPGIGAYTAAAIGALAFGRDEIALDGNLRRVLSRLSNLEIDPRRPEGTRRLTAYARAILPSGRAADFNQALMDLGSLVCLPREPRCPKCPLAKWCAARRAGVASERPIRMRRKPVPRRVATAGVLRRGGRVLIARRPPGKLLGGLWEFPGGKRRSRESLQACLRRELKEELGVDVAVTRPLGQVRHAYSHFHVLVHVYGCRLLHGKPAPLEHRALRWAAPAQLRRYPMGKVARTIARALVSGETLAPGSSGIPRRRTRVRKGQG
ncbi:MAG: A/G-specific adenine glycosylase [Gammaproteobacteria bacterium RBG_16_66_13]|nr:MAG: A/G-specific adenine glycosylase [Gammaproteobacteria bacterium RBG_16_66_13]